MEKFTILEGVAAPLDMINVDTDMIIPKQYLKTVKRTGLGKGLFAERRYREPHPPGNPTRSLLVLARLQNVQPNLLYQ